MSENFKMPSDSLHTMFSRWRSFVYYNVILFMFLSTHLHKASGDHDQHQGAAETVFNAIVNMTYIDPATKKIVTKQESMGRYGTDSKKDSVTGVLVHVRTKENKTDGCTNYSNPIPSTKWIALIERGDCPFEEKIFRAVKIYNASAVVIYKYIPNTLDPDKEIIKTGGKDVVSIFIGIEEGNRLANLVDSGKNVTVRISVGERRDPGSSSSLYNPHNISKTSVLFVSISFIVLMIISLAWLVFYYIQRFRYAHAKERLTRRLASAAKKAIAKIPQRSLKIGDKELETDFDQCAVCIEGYKPSDVIRSLPCRHIFHKSCVDPWLLEMRSCPMCKMDILRAYGMQLNSSKETVHDEGDSGATASALADEAEQLSSPDDHRAESMNIVLIRPSFGALSW
ncbi:hypothetical protein KUTeg_025007 [Tegillarca granosa]|uniref:RING-type domain-containing protein n=1 Tax=Tegillarca granosa TaxID=220873 RepID=A0ABQ9DZ06_TEGGR|nr:hypothetical protein KUTeg_025007 [Tegillarca granosa]